MKFLNATLEIMNLTCIRLLLYKDMEMCYNFFELVRLLVIELDHIEKAIISHHNLQLEYDITNRNSTSTRILWFSQFLLLKPFHCSLGFTFIPWLSFSDDFPMEIEITLTGSVEPQTNLGSREFFPAIMN